MKLPSASKKLEYEISQYAKSFGLRDQSIEFARWPLWDMSSCEFRVSSRYPHPSGPMSYFDLLILPLVEPNEDGKELIIPEHYGFLDNGVVLTASFPVKHVAGQDVEAVTLSQENIRTDQRVRVANCLHLGSRTFGLVNVDANNLDYRGEG